MTMLTIGTGVGGAIVSGGRLFRGGFGAAGEIGHLRVVPGGHPCGCGQKGCIEQYGSGRALLRFANDIADAGGIGQSLARGAARRLAARSTARSSRASSRTTTQVPSRHSGNSATGSGRRARRSGRFSTRRSSCSAGEWRLRATCCSTPSASRSSPTLPARGFHPEPLFTTAQLVNDAGVVGAADLARIHAASPAHDRLAARLTCPLTGPE